MSKIILYIAASLDGYIADTDGGVSWLDRFMADDQDYGFQEFTNDIDVNIQGANTYKQVLGFGGEYPYKSKSFVITRDKLDKPPEGKVEFVEGDLKEIARIAKSASKKDVWLVGGANIFQGMQKEGLIDEMLIFVMPLTLGEGVSLFGNSGIRKDIKLIDSEKYKSGVVKMHYRLN